MLFDLILDYLWTRLPVVATVGDSFGDCLDAEGLGRGVPPEDVDALERALEEMLYDEAAVAAARERVRAFAERFRWRSVLASLLEFCARPARAQDLALTGGAAGSSGRALQEFDDVAPPHAFVVDAVLGLAIVANFARDDEFGVVGKRTARAAIAVVKMQGNARRSSPGC